MKTICFIAWLVLSASALAGPMTVGSTNGTAVNVTILETNAAGWSVIGTNNSTASSNSITSTFLTSDTNRNIFGGSNNATLWKLNSTDGGGTFQKATVSGLATVGGIASTARVPNSITVGGSPFNWTNIQAYAMEVFLTSATGSDPFVVNKNAHSIYGSAGGCAYVVVQPGGYITITYSAGTPIMITNQW